MARQRPQIDGRWMILLRGPKWSQPVPSSRVFSTPEAACFYADALIADPDLWVSEEGPALCRLLESEAPDQVRVRITTA